LEFGADAREAVVVDGFAEGLAGGADAASEVGNGYMGVDEALFDAPGLARDFGFL